MKIYTLVFLLIITFIHCNLAEDSLTADIVYIVDEYTQTRTEILNWLSNAISGMEQVLQSKGLGKTQNPNRYGLITFGSEDTPKTSFFNDSFFTNYEEFYQLIGPLINSKPLTDTLTDGYHAIETALSYPYRIDATRFLVFVSPRQQDLYINPHFREYLVQRLLSEPVITNFFLNVSYYTDVVPITPALLITTLGKLIMGENSTTYYINKMESNGILKTVWSLAVDKFAKKQAINSGFDYTQLIEDYLAKALANNVPIPSSLWDINNILNSNILNSEYLTQAFLSTIQSLLAK